MPPTFRPPRPALLAVALSIAAGGGVRAQTAGFHYTVDRWNTDVGLPENGVNAIVQTRDGYLWLGTFGGAVRFDGTSFVTPSDRARGAIPSQRVVTLAQDASGALWIGTENGIARLGAHDSVASYGARDGLPGGAAIGLVAVGDTIWTLSTQGALSRIVGGRVTVVIPANAALGDYGFELAAASGGRLWVHGRTGIWLMDRRTARLTRVTAIRGDTVLGVAFTDRDSSAWLTTRGGLAHVSSADTELVSLAGTPLFHHTIPNIARSSDGALWLAVGEMGLWRMPLPIHGAARMPDDKPVRITAQTSTDLLVLRVFVDREDNVWVGTRTDGLMRVRRALFTTYTRADGLAANVAAGVLADAQGRVWVGGNCGGLSVISHSGIRRITRDLPNTCVWTLAPSRDGGVWVGTYGGGLGHLLDGSFAWYGPGDGLPSSAILSLFTDRDGTLWIGTENGLTRFRDGRFVTYDTSRGLVQSEVRTIYQARDGALWLGTHGGVSRFQHGRFTNYTAANGLPRAYVRAIYQDTSGTLWFGTYGGGLARLRGDSMRVFTTSDGLFDNVISSITADARGNLWMSSNRGVFVVSLRALDDYARGALPRIFSTAYGISDGMISAETNGGFEPAVTRTPDGRLWYPTVAGVAVIDPAAAATNPVPPVVHIDAVAVNGRIVTADSTVVVGPGSADVEISYSGLSFSQPNAVIFRYRLAGWDDKWVEAGTRRSAYYSRLAPGRYRFLVSAANRDGVWSDSTTALSVTVRAALWQTWWFRILALAVVMLGVLGAVRARIVRLGRAHAQQHEYSRQLIAREEAERKRVAGELHDSLGQDLLVVKNRALLAMHALPAGGPAHEQVAQISDVASDAIANVRRIAQNLRPYQIDRLGLTTALRSGIDAVAIASGLEFDVSVDDIDGLLSTEAEINLFRIVQESLNNVVKHAKATHVRVRIERTSDSLRLEIVDDGHGFVQLRGSQIALTPGGMGLSGIAERTQILGGSSSVDSTPGIGTRVRVSVPLRPATVGAPAPALARRG
jgi:signal transduction histidine kinase/ligand-binding sensor domain-containing protein